MIRSTTRLHRHAVQPAEAEPPGTHAITEPGRVRARPHWSAAAAGTAWERERKREREREAHPCGAYGADLSAKTARNGRGREPRDSRVAHR
eukprot:7202599-Prymnesium_polylepis.1